MSRLKEYIEMAKDQVDDDQLYQMFIELPNHTTDVDEIRIMTGEIEQTGLKEVPDALSPKGSKFYGTKDAFEKYFKNSYPDNESFDNFFDNATEYK